MSGILRTTEGSIRRTPARIRTTRCTAGYGTVVRTVGANEVQGLIGIKPDNMCKKKGKNMKYVIFNAEQIQSKGDTKELLYALPVTKDVLAQFNTLAKIAADISVDSYTLYLEKIIPVYVIEADSTLGKHLCNETHTHYVRTSFTYAGGTSISTSCTIPTADMADERLYEYEEYADAVLMYARVGCCTQSLLELTFRSQDEGLYPEAFWKPLAAVIETMTNELEKEQQ